jgi:Domain of unknown function (DUF4157)
MNSRMPLQLKPISDSPPVASSLVGHSRLLAPTKSYGLAGAQEVLSQGGRSLGQETRSLMESRFRYDFSHVRVHEDVQAADSAEAIGAQAYTAGSHIVFGAGRYQPDTLAGWQLLAHELTHVVQQDGRSSTWDGTTSAGASDTSEKEAGRAEKAISEGSPVDSFGKGVAPQLQRKPLAGEDDLIHRPLIEDYRRKHDLPASGIDEDGHAAGPSAADIKYVSLGPAGVAGLARDLQALIDKASWKEIRKIAYPKESAAGIQRAKDRHAGKLADLTGLGRLKTLDHFATAVRGLQKSWPTLSPDARVQSLGKAANVELKDAEVAEYLLVDREEMAPKGYFQPALWKFVINDEVVQNSTLSDPEAGDVTNTALHEARHAEQHFLAARFSAGKSKTAKAIAKEQEIPEVIAQKAVAKKFDANTDQDTAARGAAMFQASVTDSDANQAISDDQSTAIDLLDKNREAARVALNNLKDLATPKHVAKAQTAIETLKFQMAVVEQKYGLYRRIPYEADSHEVGDAAEQAFKGWPP